MTRKEIAERFAGLLRSQMDTEAGQIIILKMVAAMDGNEADSLLEEAEAMTRYCDYLTEREAREIVAGLHNHDGSRGPHWKDCEAMTDVVESYGISTDVEGQYNRWAWFVTMNRIWSDMWGVLKGYVQTEDEARVSAELTRATLMDADRPMRLREYYRLDTEE